MAENTPHNIRNKVIYQIFTRNYKDGTFCSVEEDLDRIQNLGVDIIYLLPIHPNGKKNRKGSIGSPYAISDYRSIDPMQGTMDDFESLCKAVHDRGMQIIIDVVYNHTSPDSVLMDTHPEWFYKKDDGSFGNRIGDWWDVVDLDYSNPGLWDYLIDTLKFWARYVDGFRCDVAPMIPLEFWRRARSEVAKIRPECIWLAESGEPMFINILHRLGINASSDGELYQAFDLTYDYDVYGDMKDALLGKQPVEKYVEAVNRQEWIYPENYGKMRFLENHDRPRAASLIPNEKMLKSWTSWAYFCKGPMMIYAGEEFCVSSHPSLFEMDTINFETGKDISELLANLSRIKKHSIFSDGIFNAEMATLNNDVIVGVWQMPNSDMRALGYFPLGGEVMSVKADLPDGEYLDEISKNKITIFENVLPLNGEPVVILTDKKYVPFA